MRYYTHIYILSENIPFRMQTSFADISIFFQKISIFGKNGTFIQSSSVRALVTVNGNLSFTDHAFGFRIPDYSNLAKNRKNYKKVINC